MRNSLAPRGDPRRPEAIVKYHLPKVDIDELSADYYGFLGMMLGMAAAVLRHKWAAWVGLFCCILGFMNEKTSTRESALGMQAFTSLLFSLMALVLQYVPVFLSWRA